jgi:hypothetical protein
VVIEDTVTPVKPDAVFPNNWISFHHDGTVVIYPMMAENRRIERRLEVLNELQQNEHFSISRIFDLSGYEMENKFLEGTGSVVFDYVHKIAYANPSPRTHLSLLDLLCNELGFTTYVFPATDRYGRDIYHTNVVMCIGQGYVLICLEAIRDQEHLDKIRKNFMAHEMEIIPISYRQLESFAGNMIELENPDGEKFLAMSGSAFRSLTDNQVKIIGRYATPLYTDIPVIEKLGGGSVRCMIAGIYLPKNN